MQLIDTDLSLAEREQVEAAMGSDKQVLWAGRPVAKAWTLESALAVCSGVVACGFMGFVAHQFLGGRLRGGLALLPCFLLRPVTLCGDDSVAVADSVAAVAAVA